MNVYILTYRISAEEIKVFDALFGKFKFLHYQVYDINESTPPLEMLQSAKVILSFDKTKNKSAFEKKFESIYGGTITDKLVSFIHIGKPSSFLASEEIRQTTWELISKYCGLRYVYVDPKILSSVRLSYMADIITYLDNNSTVYTLECNDGNVITIAHDNAPDDIKAKADLLLSELLVMRIAIDTLPNVKGSISTMYNLQRDKNE